MAEFSDALTRLHETERPGVKHFQDVISRLAHSGVIVAEDSQVEAQLYEAAAQLKDELMDFFALLGCTLFHESKLGYFRLFPPAAKSPCIAPSSGARESDDAGSPLLRRRGNPNVSAALLSLRAIYQQKLASGDVSSGRGEVATSVEDIYVTMKVRLKREPSQNGQERRGALRELESVWRVIRIPVDADPDDRQTRITIRPMIADLIGESVALHAEEEAAELAEHKGEGDEA
jgi:hypothetical protein